MGFCAVQLIRLRFTDTYTPRPYNVPLNVRIRRNGREVDVPVLGFIGMAGVLFVLTEVVLTHAIGRIAGPAWVALCFVYYALYRRSKRMPVFRTVRHDWEKQQQEVLEDAEEFDLLERYRSALAARDRARQERGA